MWIRIACPNAHQLDERETRFAARTGNCPQCMSPVAMWIKVQCPNKHVLRVKAKYAGQTGKCPQCAAAFKIPKISEEDMAEMFLAAAGDGKPVAKPAPKPAVDDTNVLTEMPRDDGSSIGSVVTGGSTMLKRAPKTCPKCKQQCSAKYTICPHCRTFLPFTDMGEAAEASGHIASMNCPSCGVKSFPGDTACRNCGVVLME